MPWGGEGKCNWEGWGGMKWDRVGWDGMGWDGEG